MTLELPFQISVLKSKMAIVIVNPFEGIKPGKKKRRTNFAFELVLLVVGNEFEE